MHTGIPPVRPNSAERLGEGPIRHNTNAPILSARAYRPYTTSALNRSGLPAHKTLTAVSEVELTSPTTTALAFGAPS